MKQEHKHTPGPWSLSLNIDGDYLLDTGDTEETAVIFVTEENNGIANATLIAAAPDLLEALEAMLAAFSIDSGGNINHPKYLAIMQAAIAIRKAEATS